MGRSIFLTMRTVASPLTCSLLLLFLLALPSPAEAKRQTTVRNGRPVVVHGEPVRLTLLHPLRLVAEDGLDLAGWGIRAQG